MARDSDPVRLRPVQEPDLPILERIDTEPALTEPFEWRGFVAASARRRRWEKDGYLGPHDSALVISLPDETFVGFVSWRSISISGPQGVFELGIMLLPEYRGQGYGTVAQRLLVDYLFATTTANRLEATTEIDNVPEHRSLEKAGFVREGVLRGRGFVPGRWRDGLMYARLRDDPAPDQ